MTPPPATVNLGSLVYGEEGVPLDDPAELFHEASKLYPSFAARQLQGARALELSPELQASSLRSVKRHPHLPAVPLPEAELPPVPLGEALAARRSARAFGHGAIALGDLSSLAHAAHGVTAEAELLRAAPSGGALYPLELYAVAAEVAGLPAGAYHYDPHRHVLEALPLPDLPASLPSATAYPDLAGTAAAAFVVGAVFWRTRFKYGLRGYRFALLEAGHLVQNLLLAATALGLAAVPLGGFYDRLLDDLLGFDGVNESSLYVVLVGRRP